MCAMRRVFGAHVSLFLGLLLAPACATGGSAGPAAGSGQAMPAIEVKTLTGQPLALNAMAGKVVLVDVWASWCEPCKKELPMLDDMAARLKDRGVEIVAVSIDEERANVDQFISGRAKWSLTLAHDPAQGIAEKLRPEKMPTSYVVDKGGVIRYVNGGFVPEDAPKIEAQLRALAQ